MTLETTRWDVTELMKSAAAVAAYLDAVFEAGDADEPKIGRGRKKCPFPCYIHFLFLNSRVGCTAERAMADSFDGPGTAGRRLR